MKQPTVLVKHAVIAAIIALGMVVMQQMMEKAFAENFK